MAESSQTLFKLSSHLGVDLNVSLADMPPHHNTLRVVEQSQRSAFDPPSLESYAHRLFVMGTIVSPDRPTVPLDDRSMSAITAPMLEDINSLRDGWLNISDLHAAPSDLSHDEENRAAFQHAVVINLIPVSIPTDLTSSRRVRVHLEWVDARLDHCVPLAHLFQPASLPLHLRDLVSQLTSRLLVETLLRHSASAKLYHRSWQHRQRDAVPLVCSIASSMRSLLSRTSDPAKLEPYLRRLQLSQALPNVITITNLLTELDLTCHSPSLPPSTAAASRKRSQLDKTCRAIVSSLDFAADGPDSDYDWIDADPPPQPTSQDYQQEEDDEIDSLLSFAPEPHDDDGSEGDTGAAWAEILQFSQNPIPTCIKTEDVPQQGLDCISADSPRRTGATAAEDDFRGQPLSSFEPNSRPPNESPAMRGTMAIESNSYE